MPFEEVFLTARVIAIALVSGVAIGLPATVAACALLKLKPTAQEVWFYSPLVGTGLTILFCQNLVYLDVVVSQSAVFIWSLSAIGWIWLLLSSARRALLRPIPALALGLGAAVYLVHAAGLLELGASNYYGYGWGDMFHYVSEAQFLTDYPFHSHSADQEFLRTAQYYKFDRIGQSVLHAFVAASAGADAQQAFGTTIILSPFLMFFAFLALFRSIAQPSSVSYVAALAGALFPGIAMVHLECFLSQALSMPFLILWPIAVNYLIASPSWRSALCAGLTLSVIASVYTELVPLVLGITVVCSLMSEVVTRKHTTLKSLRIPLSKLFLSLLAVFFIALVCNLGFAEFGLKILFSRSHPSVSSQSSLDGLYPWAFDMEGLTRLWLGDQIQLHKRWIIVVIATATLLMLAINFMSLAWYFVRRRSIIVLGCLLMMFAPAAPFLIGGGTQYSYQFYKLMLTVAPLHAFWLVVCGHLLCQSFEGARRWTYAAGVILVGFNFTLVCSITQASANGATLARSQRGGAHLLTSEGFRHLRAFLASLKNRDVFTLWFDQDSSAGFLGAYRTAWINYYARQNRVRSLIAAASVQADPTAPPIDYRFSKANLSSVSSPLIISWKEIDELANRKVSADPPVFLYETKSYDELRLAINESRVSISRKLNLDAASKIINSETWYPIWVAGKPGNASLLTIKFGPPNRFNEFRYDQWGYPTVHLRPEGDCKGVTVVLQVQIFQLDKRLRLVCNGASVEADIPLSSTMLPSTGPTRFGWNAGIAQLEGKYPLAEVFPGMISEVH